jgi:hypothetical protein
VPIEGFGAVDVAGRPHGLGDGREGGVLAVELLVFVIEVIHLSSNEKRGAPKGVGKEEVLKNYLED